MVEKRFIELQKQIFSLFDQNRLDEALTKTLQAQTEFPMRMDKTSFWQACIYSLQGKTDEAIAALKQALEKGVWWNPQFLMRDSDLKSLQELAEFQEVLDQCRAIYETASKSGKVELEVHGNPQADVTIFSLHMRGNNAKDTAQFWMDQQTLEKHFFAFPKSSQASGSNSFCWDDPEIVNRDILEAYQLVKEKQMNTDSKLILGGGSQGGKVALELFLQGIIPEASGFILVVPSVTNLESIESLLKQYKRNNVRSCIITGDQDYCYTNILALMPMLEAHSIDCKLIVKEGMGHFYPDDFADLVKEAVEFISN